MAEPRKRTAGFKKTDSVQPVDKPAKDEAPEELPLRDDEGNFIPANVEAEYWAGLNAGTDSLEKIEARNRVGLPKHILERQAELRADKRRADEDDDPLYTTRRNGRG